MIIFSVFKGMVMDGKDGKSYLADGHFAQLEGIKEESTLLLRNFYKSKQFFLEDIFFEKLPSGTFEKLPNRTFKKIAKMLSLLTTNFSKIFNQFEIWVKKFKVEKSGVDNQVDGVS